MPPPRCSGGDASEGWTRLVVQFIPGQQCKFYSSRPSVIPSAIRYTASNSLYLCFRMISARAAFSCYSVIVNARESGRVEQAQQFHQNQGQRRKLWVISEAPMHWAVVISLRLSPTTEIFFLANTTLIERLRDAFRHVKRSYPLTIDAIVFPVEPLRLFHPTFSDAVSSSGIRCTAAISLGRIRSGHGWSSGVD